MTQEQYIAGGVIGTIFGLGIGHAIQSRYPQKGWIFTVGDAAAYGLLVGGNIIIANEPAATTGKISGAGVTLTTVGALGLLGMRIWEIIDLWATPQTQNLVLNDQATKGKLAFIPLVAPTYMGLSLSY